MRGASTRASMRRSRREDIDHVRARRGLSQHSAGGRRHRREAGRTRQRDRPRGDGTRRSHEALHAPGVCGRTGLGHGGDGAPASRRQLDAARRRRADPARRHRRRRRHRRLHRRLLRRSSRHELQGARRARAGHRRRRARRPRADRDAIPGLEQGDIGQGHGEVDAGLGERSGRLCGRARDARRCHRGRRRRRGGGAGGARAKDVWRRQPRAKPTRPASGRAWRKARSDSTCTACASRWPRPACATSIRRR